MEFAKRAVSSAALILITILAINIEWLFIIVVTALIVFALNEFYAMVESAGVKVFRYFGILVGIVIPISISFRFELTKSWELFFITLAFIIFFLLQLNRKDSTWAVVAISVTLFGIFYISWLFSFIIKLRFLRYGPELIGMLILVTKAGDMGAYFVGSRWGKTPLLSRISPKKTVEGALAGLVFNVVFALLSRVFLPVFSFWHLAFLGVFIGVLSLFGDLSESLIKRDCRVKDAGKIFPGLGGVLDVIDSLIFACPALYFYTSVIFS